MGWFEIFVIILSLVSSFVAKKNGASTTEAALVGAGVGLGTYYVGTQTQWGKDLVASIDAKWFNPTENGQPVLNADGSKASIPAGATVVKDANGNVVRDASGSVVYQLGNLAGKVVDTAGSTLQSWGASGTAKVIGTTAVASNLEKYLPWVVGGLLAYALISQARTT